TLRPQDVAACCSAGIREVSVVPCPRVAILSTGDELLPYGSPPTPGRIVDSNSILLSQLVERDGGRIVSPGESIIHDDPDSIRQAMASLADEVYCLLVSGSTSRGRRDYAVGVLAELGHLAFHGVQMRPGGSAAYGMIRSTPVVLLPGNPVA